MKRETLKNIADKVFWTGVGTIFTIAAPMMGIGLSTYFGVSAEVAMPVVENLACIGMATGVPLYLAGGIAGIALE